MAEGQQWLSWQFNIQYSKNMLFNRSVIDNDIELVKKIRLGLRFSLTVFSLKKNWNRDRDDILHRCGVLINCMVIGINIAIDNTFSLI